MLKAALMQSLRLNPALLAAASLATALAGCGGGADTTTPTPGPVPPAATITRFSGVAATGAAMANAAVQVKCAVGAASGTTAANGSYSLELSDATLPCVVSALSADGKTLLHSMADPLGGTTQTIQINPVTELMVARLAQGSAQTFFTTFDAAAQGKLTATAFSDAATAVEAVLKDAGVDLTALGNPVKATLVPAAGQTAGNAYDQALDALAVKLAQSGSSLQQVASSVSAAALPAAASDTTASLPAAALLRPAHADCAALRSGPYRFLSPSSDASRMARLVQIDAPGATITWPDGSKSVATSTGGCTFRQTAEQVRLVVSPSGVLVGLSLTSANVRMTVGLPEQPAALADLAGDWNWAGFFEVNEPATNLRAMDMGTVSITGTGAVTAITNCPMLGACAAQATNSSNFSVNGEGGFNLADSLHAPPARSFLYKPGNGDAVVFTVDATQLMVFSKVRSRPLPTLNSTWSRLDANVNPQMVANDGFTFSSYSAVAVDATAKTATRRRTQDGAEQVFKYDHPRSGVAYRAAGTTLLNTGATQSFSEVFVLPLGSTGVYAFGRQTLGGQRNLGSFGFSVDVPASAAAGVGSVR